MGAGLELAGAQREPSAGAHVTPRSGDRRSPWFQPLVTNGTSRQLSLANSAPYAPHDSSWESRWADPRDMPWIRPSAPGDH
eukprot:gene15762-21884_t